MALYLSYRAILYYTILYYYTRSGAQKDAQKYMNFDVDETKPFIPAQYSDRRTAVYVPEHSVAVREFDRTFLSCLFSASARGRRQACTYPKCFTPQG